MAEDAFRPLVTILIPVFNGADYLADAIDSALAQTWSNVEVIVVDDGSDDAGATAAICVGYGKRIRYFHKVNGGVSTALNLGLRVMRGEFLSWLSHDDLYTPDRIEIMVDAWRRRMSHRRAREVILCSDFMLCDADGQELTCVRAPRGAGGLAAVEIVPHGCSMFVARNYFDRAGGFHPGLPTTHDADMWLRLQSFADLEPVARVTIRSRQHEAQGSRARWHMAEVVLNRLSMLDRVDSGFLDLTKISRAERYRSVVDGSRLAGTPGVRIEAARRLEREVETGTIALVWLGWRGSVSHEVLPVLWRNGYRVTLVRLPRLTPEAMLEALAQLRCDFVWLWDAPLDPPARMLELLREMMAVLIADPATASALPPAGSVAGDTMLRGLHGALLPVRALRRAHPSAAGVWASVAHEVVRQGGFRQVGDAQRAAFVDRVDEGFPGRGQALIARGRRHRSAFGAVSGIVMMAAARVLLAGGYVMRNAAVRLGARVLHRVASPVWRPGTLARLFAGLSARPALAAAIVRLVWRFSPGAEHARLNLAVLCGVDGYFDPEWYRRVYPDVDSSGMDPLLHFLCVGLAEARDPSAGFDARAYLADHPDVAARRLPAVLHYVVWGVDEERTVRRSRLGAEVRLRQAFTLFFPAGDGEALRLVRELSLQLGRRATVVAWAWSETGVRRLGDVDESPPEALEAAVETLCEQGDDAGVLLVNPGVESDGLVVQLGKRGLLFDAAHTRDGASECAAWLAARTHFVFSSALQHALQQRAPARPTVLMPLPDASGTRRLRPWLRVRYPREFCRVVIFGDLRDGEGLETVRAAVAGVMRWRLPISFMLVGRIAGSSLSDQDCLNVLEPASDGSSAFDALSAYNPHVAWVPERDPARALFAIAQAVEFGLPLAAVDSEDARGWLAHRPCTRLVSHRCALAWLGLLDALHRQDMPHVAWRPRRLLLGFDPAGVRFANVLLG